MPKLECASPRACHLVIACGAVAQCDTTEFGHGIWTVEGDRLRMLGIPFFTRTTLIRLSGGGLWVHSPVALSGERAASVEALGLVEHIVAPNKLHHLHLDAWHQRYPSAKLWAAPGLRERRRDLEFDAVLSDQSPAAWSREMDQLIFQGSRILPEVVFLHRASRTLIVTDIIQNHDPSRDSWFWRTIKRIDGVVAPNGGVPRDYRLTVRDRASAKRCLDRMLGWDFDRLIVSHGRCVQQGAHDFVARAFAWLG